MQKWFAFLSKHLIGFAVIALTVKTAVTMIFGFGLEGKTVLDWLLLCIAPLGSALFFAGCSFLFGKTLRPSVLFIMQVLATGILYANLLYYRFYIDFVTVSVFLQLQNVGGLGPSTLELASPFDLLLFLDLGLLLYLIYFYQKRKTVRPLRPKKQKYIAVCLATIVLTFGTALTTHPYLLKTAYDRKLLVQSLGIFHYQAVNLAVGLRAPLSKQMANEAVAKDAAEGLYRDTDGQDPYYGVAKGMNVVLISLESTQNFVINQKVHGQEITPFLNKMVQDSYYFSNIYDQTAQGKTSDAEMMIDTGLYPLPSGSVFVRRPSNTFDALPTILKQHGNYGAYVFHANDPSFWNRAEIYQSLGYHHFYSKGDYKVLPGNSVNYGLKDIPFLQQTVPYLQDIKTPYLAKLILLTNHFPFLLDQQDQFIEPAHTNTDVVNRYVTTVRYEDEALKRFFKKLKQEGLYDNTIFVIYGDHYGISRKYEAGVHELLGNQGTPLDHLALQRIPLIVHVPGQKGREIQTLGGEIDIRATLLHLLGIPNADYPSFSRNLFSRDNQIPVVFRDGSMVTEDIAYVDHVCYDRHTEKAVEKDSCTPFLKQARKQLDISDDIILGDLLRFRSTSVSSTKR